MANPEVNNPEMTNAKMANAEMANAEMVNTEMVNAEMGNPEMANPEMANPEMANPEMTKAKMANAAMANAEMANAEMANAGMVNAETVSTEIACTGTGSEIAVEVVSTEIANPEMAAVPKKREHKEMNLESKYKALLELDKGKTNKEVASLFGVPPNTVSTWKRNKTKIYEAFQNGSPSTKRIKIGKYDQINKAVLQWFEQAQSENVPITGALIREQALCFAKELNIEHFQASEGWLQKWKKR